MPSIPTTRFHAVRWTKSVGWVRRFAGLIFAMCGVRAPAQVYSFTTLVGRPDVGSSDGAAADARFNEPRGLAVDGHGNVFVADTGNQLIRKVAPNGAVTTLAGVPGVRGSTDGPGRLAHFDSPLGIAVDRTGNVYVADTNNHVIRRIAPDGEVITWAGAAEEAGSADGQGRSARFHSPSGLAVDSNGNLIVADTFNVTVRKITPDGQVTTLAGTAGARGRTDGIGPAARFGSVNAVVAGANGDVFVSDQFDVGTSHFPQFVPSVRRISATGDVTTIASGNTTSLLAQGIGFTANHPLAIDSNGTLYTTNAMDSLLSVTSGGVVTMVVERPVPTISSLAAGAGDTFFIAGGQSISTFRPGGPVTAFAGALANDPRADGVGGLARFADPRGLAVDAAGNLFVADWGSYTLRKVTPDGVVTTFAGSPGNRGVADGTGTAARFYGPNRMTFDRNGNLIVMDVHGIRKVTPQAVVTTLAGDPANAGSADGLGQAARFFFPSAVTVDASNTLFVTDEDNHTIRKISPDGQVTTIAGLAGSYGWADGKGTAARFGAPSGIVADGKGVLWVADRGSLTIRKVTTDGEVTTFAGGSTYFSRFDGLTIDGRGNLFVADDSLIHRITLAGEITTIGGPGFHSSGIGPDGTGLSARFNYPKALAMDGAGNLFVAVSGENVIRKGVPLANPARLVNTSVLATLAGGDDSVAMGVIVGGAGSGATMPMLARAAGPALNAFGVPGAIADPKLQFFSGSTSRGENDDWGGAPGVIAAAERVGAFPFATTSSKDAALLLPSIGTGGHTFRVTSNGSIGGAVLAELYDATATSAASSSPQQFKNLSVLKRIESSVTLGFIIGGEGTKTLLIRAAGPSLATFGVKDPLANPRIELFDRQARNRAKNNDWNENGPQAAAELNYASSLVGAFGFPPAGSKDSALLVDLPPGNYTVQATSADGTPGTVLVEVYAVP